MSTQERPGRFDTDPNPGNKSFAVKAKEILSSHLVANAITGEVYSEHRFRLPSNDPVSSLITLELANTPVGGENNDFDYVKHLLRFPLFHLNRTIYRRDLSTTTPYGILPSRVIDANGRLFFFANSYFFNHFGEVAKFEEIIRLTSEKVREEKDVRLFLNANESLLKLPRSNIKFKASDSRFVKLEPGDYENVQYTLDSIA